jgi:hypothetical protein
MSDEKYFATEEEPEKLIECCKERVTKYADYLRASKFYARILRNLRYYHNIFYSFSGGMDQMELKALGEEGELVGISINHFRNLMQHIIGLVTSTKLAFQPKAVNTEQESLDQARLGNNLLEYYLYEKRFDRNLERALEHSMILLSGHVLTEWDPYRGQEVAGEIDPETGEERIIRDGDIRILNPTIFDVAYDFTNRCWEENQWFIIRKFENKWDLAKRNPERAAEILAEAEEEKDAPWESHQAGLPGEYSDRVSVFCLYHESTEAVPGGKYFEFVGKVPLTETMERMPYKTVTLRRMVPGETLMTCLGYSPAMDLQGLQEAYNGESSAIITNHKSFGVQNVWVHSDDQVDVDKIDGGLNLIRSRVEPKGINLTATPAEIFKFRQDLAQDMEYISGVNSVARGQPEANLKSGTALALIDSKAVQFNSPIEKNYIRLAEDVASDILWILNRFPAEGNKRVYAIAGKHQRVSKIEFQRGDLDRIDRVIVKTGSAMTKTQSGRFEIATMYLKAGLIRLPEELTNVLDTGQIDTLLEAEQSQLQIIRDENEKMIDMMQGRAEHADQLGGPQLLQPIQALATDNHTLHIREHQVLLNSTEVRRDSQKSMYVLAHIMQHITLLQDPATQALQAVLGFQSPLLSTANNPSTTQRPKQPGTGPEPPLNAPPGPSPARPPARAGGEMKEAG